MIAAPPVLPPAAAAPSAATAATAALAAAAQTLFLDPPAPLLFMLPLAVLLPAPTLVLPSLLCAGSIGRVPGGRERPNAMPFALARGPGRVAAGGGDAGASVGSSACADARLPRFARLPTLVRGDKRWGVSSAMGAIGALRLLVVERTPVLGGAAMRAAAAAARAALEGRCQGATPARGGQV